MPRTSSAIPIACFVALAAFLVAMLAGIMAGNAFATVLGLVPAADVLIWLPISISGVGVRESVFALALEPWGILAPSAVAIGIVRWTGELARGAIGCMLMALGEGRSGRAVTVDPEGENRDE